MKVVDVDMFARESVADILIAENLSSQDASAMVGELNRNRTEDNSDRWARVVKDDYRLSRGMEDLV